MNASCYTNIIGLSRTDCTCFDPKPEGYSTSLSGLYIDDELPLEQLGDLSDCSNKDVWTILARAREQAISTFEADSSALLLRFYQLARRTWKGQIGESIARESLNLSSVYAGLRVKCAPIPSGVMKIDKIGMVLDATGIYTLKIYDNLNRQVGSDISVEAEAGKLKVTELEPLLLPLVQPDNSNLEYFFVYALGGQPKAIKVSCGCGGFKPVFDTDMPYYFRENHRANSAWSNWAMFGSWSGDTLTDFDNCNSTTSDYTNGLVLYVDLYCKVSETICKDAMSFDGSDPLALSTAYAVLYKAREIAAGKVLADTNLTRANVINRENLEKVQFECMRKYNEHVNYIVQNADLQQSGCLCRKPKMSMKSILT